MGGKSAFDCQYILISCLGRLSDKKNLWSFSPPLFLNFFTFFFFFVVGFMWLCKMCLALVSVYTVPILYLQELGCKENDIEVSFSMEDLARI